MKRPGIKVLAAIALSFISTTALEAQTNAAGPEVYFNEGAATFITQTTEKALAIVNEGLQLHPDNEALLKLKALIEQQQQQNQDQQDQDQQQSDPSDASDENEQNDPPPDQNQEDDQAPESSEDEESDEPEPDEMTEEEAEMVLDSLRQLEEAQREQLMQEMIRKKMRDMPPVEKDW